MAKRWKNIIEGRKYGRKKGEGLNEEIREEKKRGEKKGWEVINLVQV